MPKVTALVSAYYAEPFMHQRLLNLAGQKPKPEIVVICQKESAEYKIAKCYDVKIITTENIPTIGKAWNLAISISSGEYLTTANTDDLYKVDGMMRMAQVLDEHPDVGLVFSDVDLKQGEQIRYWIRYHGNEGIVSDMEELLKTRCFIGSMPMWRRSCMPGWFDEELIVASDYDMWTRMAKAGVKFYYIPESLGIYESREDSLEHRNRNLLPSENRKVRA